MGVGLAWCGVVVLVFPHLHFKLVKCCESLTTSRHAWEEARLHSPLIRPPTVSFLEVFTQQKHAMQCSLYIFFVT